MSRRITMIGIYKLPAPIYVSGSCLDKNYKVSIGSLSGIATTPILQWTPDDRPIIVSPAMESHLKQYVEHYATAATEGWDKWNYWGEVTGWHPKKHTIRGVHLGAILLKFKIDPKFITYSEYLHGRGTPEGKDVQLLFENMDQWFERLRTWIGAARDQDIDPVNPIRGSSLKADGLQLFTIDGSTMSLPRSSYNITVMFRSGGEHVTAPTLRKALNLASSGAFPSDAHVLLRDSRAALWRGSFRRAVIDAGSATEVCLADCNNRAAPPVPLPPKPTLGT